MASRPTGVDNLVAELRAIESWLTSSLGVATDGTAQSETTDPFAPPDDLVTLKAAIDRVRPLLWVYLTRQNEAKAASRPKSSAPVRTLMEDAITISDRYVRKDDQ
jgi:hypothetical protein